MFFWCCGRIFFWNFLSKSPKSFVRALSNRRRHPKQVAADCLQSAVYAEAKLLQALETAEVKVCPNQA